MQYFRITENSRLPDLSAFRPFKVVFVGEDRVSPERCSEVCAWLVDSGCLYAMAWGEACDEWYGAIQQANRQAHAAEQIPDKSLIIATVHADESLRDTFWFARYTAMHPCFPLDNLVLLHVGAKANKKEVLAIYENL